MTTSKVGSADLLASASLIGQDAKTAFTVERAEIRVQHIAIAIGAGVTSLDIPLDRPVQSLSRAFLRHASNTQICPPTPLTEAVQPMSKLGVRAELIDVSTIRFTRGDGASLAVIWYGELWEYKGPAGGVNEFEVLEHAVLTMAGGVSSASGTEFDGINANRAVPFLSGFETSDVSSVSQDDVQAMAWDSGSFGKSQPAVLRGATTGSVTHGIAMVHFKGSAWNPLEFSTDSTGSDTVNHIYTSRTLFDKQLYISSRSLGLNNPANANCGHRVSLQSVSGFPSYQRTMNSAANNPRGSMKHYLLENTNCLMTENVTAQGAIGSSIWVTTQSIGGLSQGAAPDAPEDDILNRMSVVSYVTTAGGPPFLVIPPEYGWSHIATLKDGCVQSILVRGKIGRSAEHSGRGFRLPLFDSDSDAMAASLTGRATLEAGGILPATHAADHDALISAALNDAAVNSATSGVVQATGQDVEVVSGNDAKIQTPGNDVIVPSDGIEVVEV